LGEGRKVGKGLGGGGCSAFSGEGEGFGVVASRAFAFLRPTVFALSLAPKSPVEVPGTTPWLAFALRLAGVAVDDGWMPRSLSPVGVPVARAGWPFGSGANPDWFVVWPGDWFVGV
jgi:hypothetical protein